MKSAHPAAALYHHLYMTIAFVAIERNEKMDSYQFAEAIKKYPVGDIRNINSILQDMPRPERINLVRQMGF